MFKLFKIFFEKAGVDKAIGLTILSRIIQAAGGVGSIFFIARYLSADEQGYYYTFASILAIQVFFELGLSGIITQYTAHESAHLNFNGSEITGDEYYKSRLSSLLIFCVKWFGIISILLLCILVFVGFYFFNSYTRNVHIEWQIPWVILCISTALNLFIDPILAYFDGLGDVKDMAQVRLFQKTTMVVLLFLFFILGFKLYSGALASLVAILVNYGQIFFSRRISKLKIIWNMIGEWKIDYMGEIFPLQWKIALSWISGYFIFQLFNPILFATEGPKVAGQMGMTLQALNGITSISMTWITTRIPLFSSLIAKKEYLSLDKLFNSTLLQLISVTIVATLSFVLALLGLRYFNILIFNRFLNPLPLVLLSAVVIANQFVFSWATYLRCHKKEPFLVNSIVIGMMCCFSTFIFGNLYGLMGIVLGYSFLMFFVSFPWAYMIFKSKKIEYHGQ